MKRTMQILVALVGILLISFVGTDFARATTTPSFTVSPERVLVGESITVTDTTANPEGKELTYRWHKNARYSSDSFTSGSSECLNATCSQAQWAYSTPGEYMVEESISSSEETWGSVSHFIQVVSASEAPSPIYLLSPSSLALPTGITLASPKPNLVAYCRQSELRETGCGMYYVKRTGPDANGLYYYRFRLPMAPVGQIVVTASAWSNDSHQADRQEFPVTVTENQIKYGDFRTCIDTRTTKALIVYYARMTTEVVFRIEQKVRQGKRLIWKARKPKRTVFTVEKVGSLGGELPYSAREARFRVPESWAWDKRNRTQHEHSSDYQPEPPTRATYLVKRGKRVIKQAHIPKRLCRELPLPAIGSVLGGGTYVLP